MSEGIVPRIRQLDQAETQLIGLARTVAARLGDLLANADRAWQRRRAQHAFESLGERGLADIGIGHGEIEHAIRHGRGEGAAERAERSRIARDKASLRLR